MRVALTKQLRNDSAFGNQRYRPAGNSFEFSQRIDTQEVIGRVQHVLWIDESIGGVGRRFIRRSHDLATRHAGSGKELAIRA